MKATKLKYDERLKLLSIQSLKNRRKIQCLYLILNINIKNSLNSIPNCWVNTMKFINNEKTGTHISIDKIE